MLDVRLSGWGWGTADAYPGSALAKPNTHLSGFPFPSLKSHTFHDDSLNKRRR